MLQIMPGNLLMTSFQLSFCSYSTVLQTFWFIQCWLQSSAQFSSWNFPSVVLLGCLAAVDHRKHLPARLWTSYHNNSSKGGKTPRLGKLLLYQFICVPFTILPSGDSRLNKIFKTSRKKNFNKSMHSNRKTSSEITLDMESVASARHLQLSR